MAAGMPREAAHSQLASALDVVVHLARSDGARRVEEVAVLRRLPDGLVVVEPAATFDRDGEMQTHPASDLLAGLLCR
jgi:pilus assembly protein CpaF